MRTPMSYGRVPRDFLDENETRLSVAVANHVLSRARGFCEGCGAPAPFRWADGSPYLEAHCVLEVTKPALGEVGRFGEIDPNDLSECGTVAALCPTCHRKAHHSLDATQFDVRLREVVNAVDDALDKGGLKVVTAAVILDEDGRVLVTERAHGEHKGMWEFPGGKVQDGRETLEKCITREIKEELSLDVTKTRPFMMVDHDYGSFFLRMHVFVCEVRGRMDLRDHSDAKWRRPHELASIRLAPADLKVADRLAAVANARALL